MATPTLTSVTPSYGHPGGKELITIEGTNFDLPPSPPATGYVGGDWDETVEVEINGEPCTDVKVWSATKLTCLTPAFKGLSSSLSADPGLDVDVLIRNIGPPAEEDTFTDEFTYKRTDLTRSDGPLRHVLRTLIETMRRQIIDNVVTSTAIDYDSSTGDSLDIVEIAEIPSIALFGPSVSEDFFRRTPERSSTQDVPNLEYEKKREPRVCILSFDATIVADSMMQGAHLVEEFVRFFNRNQTLTVDQDSTDPSAGTVDFDTYLTSGPARSGTANADGTYSFTSTFEIHGVPIDADEGTVIEWGSMLDDPADIEDSYEEA
jgi:hypothetical protein